MSRNTKNSSNKLPLLSNQKQQSSASTLDQLRMLQQEHLQLQNEHLNLQNNFIHLQANYMQLQEQQQISAKSNTNSIKKQSKFI